MEFINIGPVHIRGWEGGARGWGGCSLAWPDRFFPFLFVDGKKRSGHARLGWVVAKA